jgi:hypothetical protein
VAHLLSTRCAEQLNFAGSVFHSLRRQITLRTGSMIFAIFLAFVGRQSTRHLAHPRPRVDVTSKWIRRQRVVHPAPFCEAAARLIQRAGNRGKHGAGEW